MASRRRLSSLAASAQTEAVAALLDGGVLELYGGLQPSTADDALSDQIRLAVCPFPLPAFEVHADGIARVGPMLVDPDAVGTAGQVVARWFRCRTREGATVLDGSVGLKDADLVLSSVEIRRHSVVTIEAFTLRTPMEKDDE